MRSNSTSVLRSCVYCGESFVQTRPTRLYCNRRCAGLANNSKHKVILPTSRDCASCGRAFKPTHPNHRHCSKDCRENIVRPLERICPYCESVFEPTSLSNTRCRQPGCSPRHTTFIGIKYALPRPTVGALSELRVCVDLMQRGYHVFRALSPACPCDLLVLTKSGQTIRIEVKTCYLSRDGQIMRPSAQTMSKHIYDVIAMVLPDRIAYEPSLEQFDAA